MEALVVVVVVRGVWNVPHDAAAMKLKSCQSEVEYRLRGARHEESFNSTCAKVYRFLNEDRLHPKKPASRASAYLTLPLPSRMYRMRVELPHILVDFAPCSQAI